MTVITAPDQRKNLDETRNFIFVYGCSKRKKINTQKESILPLPLPLFRPTNPTKHVTIFQPCIPINLGYVIKSEELLDFIDIGFR